MDKLKTILTLIAGMLIAFVVLAGIGLIYNFLFYLVLLGIICFASLIAYRFLRGANPGQLSAPNPKRELKKVERILDEYKRKQDG